MSYSSETPNLGLPQWVLSDPPQMADFNNAFSTIDEHTTFDSIVSPGGEMTGALTMNNNVSVNSKLSDGTTANLIGRNNSNNIWIGTADEGVMEKQGSVYLATSDTGNAYVGRNNVRDKILDYGFVWKELWTGTWSSGTISVPGSSEYGLFQIRLSGQGTTIPVLKHGQHLRGMGGYSSATPTIITYQFTATISGDTWTFVACNSENHSTNAVTSLVISSICGIV